MLDPSPIHCERLQPCQTIATIVMKDWKSWGEQALIFLTILRQKQKNLRWVDRRIEYGSMELGFSVLICRKCMKATFPTAQKLNFSPRDAPYWFYEESNSIVWLSRISFSRVLNPRIWRKPIDVRYSCSYFLFPSSLSDDVPLPYFVDSQMRKASKPPSEWLKLLCKDWARENEVLVETANAKFLDYKPYLKGA